MRKFARPDAREEFDFLMPLDRTLKPEVNSPEREEIERRAEYFEIEHRQRRNAMVMSAGLVLLMALGSAVMLMLGGCR